MANSSNRLYQMVSEPLTADLDHWLKHREVIRRRSAGQNVAEIAAEMGEPERTVYRWIAEATQAVRAENRSFVQEMFLISFHRLERLYEIIEKRLAKMATDDALFSRDVFRAAIDVIDRQSKLLGLDRNKVGSKGRDEFLDGASDADLVAEADRLGIRLPEKFRGPKA